MADRKFIQNLENKAYEIRRTMLSLAHQTMLHIGGDLSMADMMVALYFYKMNYNINDTQWKQRDRFVLSKGHGAGCLYITMAMAGFWKIEDVFSSYGKLNSRFGMHPCKTYNAGMDASSGSLGHGLSIAVGMALAARKKKEYHRVFTLLGDGELYEGSVWEGAMSAASFELGNLIALIDRNGMSFNAATEDPVFGMRMEPLSEKWRAFGWNVIEIDGNDMIQIIDAMDKLPSTDSKVPTVIIGKTTKGKGVKYMENQPNWHSGRLSEEQYELAVKQLAASYGTGGGGVS